MIRFCHILTCIASFILVCAFPNNATSSDVQICFVIRTYWQHGQYGGRSLYHLLEGLRSQSHTNWEALLVVMDNRNFPDLRDFVNGLKDDRVWVYAEWVAWKYGAKETNGSWTADYHNKLYNLTDEAIRACSPNTTWLVVTNGDNHYDGDFMTVLSSSPPDADLVIFDYYSRYQRPTGPPCERFAAIEGYPLCKENEARLCHTDLSANAYRWPRMVEENRLFGILDPDSRGLGFQDGYMVESLVKAGWKVTHISDRCLVEHAPSPQRCAQSSGVWDDSVAATVDHTGGYCVRKHDAVKKRSAYPEYYEIVSVNISSDGKSMGFPTGMTLQCLRQKDPRTWELRSFFQVTCTARVDLDIWNDTPDQARADLVRARVVDFASGSASAPVQHDSSEL